MLQAKNVTIKEDTNLKSLRPDTNQEPVEVEKRTSTEEATSSVPKKMPRMMLPKIDKVISLNEATRNKQKHRYRIIIGKRFITNCNYILKVL